MNVDKSLNAATKLAEQTSEQAQALAESMDKLGIATLEFGGDTYIVLARMKSNSGCTHEYVSFQDTGGDLTQSIIGNGVDDGHYMVGDFNCWLTHPTVDEVLAFAENIEAIEKALNEIASSVESRAKAAHDGVVGADLSL